VIEWLSAEFAPLLDTDTVTACSSVAVICGATCIARGAIASPNLTVLTERFGTERVGSVRMP
jgi:hypothetical protein